MFLIKRSKWRACEDSENILTFLYLANNGTYMNLLHQIISYSVSNYATSQHV